MSLFESCLRHPRAAVVTGHVAQDVTCICTECATPQQQPDINMSSTKLISAH